MKRIITLTLALTFLIMLSGCRTTEYDKQIATTTLPVYEFTTRLCQGTDVHIVRVVTEDISCLHDYTLQVSQMQKIASSDAVVITGGGLETFLDDVLTSSQRVIEASAGIEALHGHNEDNHGAHQHDQDPHIWLSPRNAAIMAENIYRELCTIYPNYKSTFERNLEILLNDLSELESYGFQQLENLTNRNLITFHDGFGYFAQAFDLHILKAIEEESGSEASATELIEICNLIDQHQVPAIFTEKNGAASAAQIISRETGVTIFSLDMAISGDSYFDAMYHNIDVIKEALG